MKDWVAWHAAYADPSVLPVPGWPGPRAAGRRSTAAPPGPVRLISLCAGQGHDVLACCPAIRACGGVGGAGRSTTPERGGRQVRSRHRAVAGRGAQADAAGPRPRGRAARRRAAAVRDLRQRERRRHPADRAGRSGPVPRRGDGHLDGHPRGRTHAEIRACSPPRLRGGAFDPLDTGADRASAPAAWRPRRRAGCPAARCSPSAAPDFMHYAGQAPGVPPARSPGLAPALRRAATVARIGAW